MGAESWFSGRALRAGFGLLVSAFLLPARAEAVPKSWENPVSGNWSDGTKWSPPGMPSSIDDVSITLAGTYTVALDTNGAANSLTLGGSSGAQTLSSAGNDLSIGASDGTVAANGVIDWGGGTLTVNGALIVDGIFNWSGGTLGLGQLILHEILASHGFIVVAIRHSATATTRVKDIPKVIDFMLSGANPLSGSIDPERIGMSGLSTGGRTTLAVTGGWATPFNNHPPIQADPRIKAMVLLEPGRDNSLEDVATISIPYLIMGGTRIVNGVVVAPEVFETTAFATPRIYVKNPEALHLGYQTDCCASIEETREAALLQDPGQAEPLTNLIPSPTNPQLRVCNPTMGAAAFTACTLWNQGELVFPTLGPSAFGFGGGRNMCRLVGVDLSSNGPLDVDPLDGFTDDFVPGTDIRLYEPNDEFNSDELTPGDSMPADVLVPMVKHYTVAFFKKYLEGDGHYMRFLTPGYANTHGLSAVVEIRD